MKNFGGTQAYRWAFHECPRQLRHWYEGTPELPHTPLQLLLFERGRELEQRYVASLQQSSSSYRDIRELPRLDRFGATRKAMAEGVEVIAHPFFGPTERFGLESLGIWLAGEGDVIRRVGDERLSSGYYPYQVTEVKSAGVVQEHHRAQLVFYSVLLAAELQQEVSTGAVITWRRAPDGLEPVENVVNLSAAQERLTEFLKVELPRHIVDPSADYHLRSTCSSCPYRGTCEAQAVQLRISPIAITETGA
jgi:predicted RecB family nuclease